MSRRSLFAVAICLMASLPTAAWAAFPGAEQPEATPNELIVLLAASPGGPKPEEVVERAQRRQPLPAGLGAGNPRNVKFGLAHRASGRMRELLEADPESPRARLERYLVFTYPEGSNLDAIQLALELNPHVLHVERNYRLRFHVSPSDPLFPVPTCPVGPCSPNPQDYQWGSHSLNLPAAWEFAKGHSYIGLIDVGIEVDHPDLRAFDASGNYVGGNFRPHLSWDYMNSSSCGSNPEGCVDEKEEGGLSCSTQEDPDGRCAGHGTHVSGIVAAGADNGQGVAGACWNCSILMTRGVNTVQAANGLIWHADHGAEAVSMSFGYADVQCDPPTSGFGLFCDSIAVAEQRDVLMTASPGNDKADIEFPASDDRVMSIGGIEPTGAFWDRADEGEGCPCNFSNRPLWLISVCNSGPSTFECGSNYTVTPGSAQQDLVAPAKQVLSTFYEGEVWNRTLGCWDDPNHAGSGYDLCTGTSMSSPYGAAVAGILRSVNPLLAKAQIRDLLITNSSRANNWDLKLGYGIPDAAASVEDALGRSGGAVVSNRLTPLFSMYSSQAEDYFYTTFPQMGAAAYWSAGDVNGYWRNAGYSSVGPDVAGYGYFPGAGCQVSPCEPEPGASVYVFATDRSPNGMPLVPLYRLSFNGPNPSNPGNAYNRDTTYTTEAAGIDAFSDLGYKLDGVEGYIYKKCTPEPSCIPAGSVRLYRRYNQQRDDFAIFPESELAAMESQGYTSNGGFSFAEVLGYVYLNVDSDGDRVINGFESLLGTDPLVADSDCDGLGDGVEILDFPYAGKDPRSGPGAILELQNQSISSTQTFEACDTIFAGPNLTIEPTGNATLHAGQRVVLRSGFRVKSGAVFRAIAP